MVFEGLSRPKAAEKAGIADHTLYLAMRKPSVLAYLNSQQQVLRTSAAARSIARIDNLADDAESEHVKLQSNVFLLGIEGVSPVTKTESLNVHKHLHAGLTIVTGGWSEHQPDAHLIGGQAHEAGSAHHINMIGESVPHPNMRNALQIEAKAQANQAPGGVPAGGQKCERDD